MGTKYPLENDISNIILNISSDDDDKKVLPRQTSHPKGSARKKKKTSPPYRKLNVKSVISKEHAHKKPTTRFGSSAKVYNVKIHQILCVTLIKCHMFHFNN